MAKKGKRDSNEAMLPRYRKSPWINDNQHDQPDTEIVGVIAVSQVAKRNVGGFLHAHANSLPSSHLKDEQFITEGDGSVNPEIQAQLAWLGAQILGMSQLEITGNQALGAAFTLEVNNPSPGVYQILLTYPEITDGVDGEDGEDGSDAPATVVRSNPAGFGNMQQNIAEAGYTDIANSDYVRRDGLFPMTGGLEILNISTGEVGLTVKWPTGFTAPLFQLLNTDDTPMLQFLTNRRLRHFGTAGNITLDGAGDDINFSKVGSNWISALTAGAKVILRVAGSDSVVAHQNGRTTFGASEERSATVDMLSKNVAWPILHLRAIASQSANILTAQPSGSTFPTQIRANGSMDIGILDATTASAIDALNLFHQTSAAPAADFGVNLRFQGRSTTTDKREMALLRAVWETPTDATRKAQVVLSAYDTAEREILRGGTDGAVAKMAVLGAPPSARINIGIIDCEGHLGAFAALDALKNFGFIEGTATLGVAPEPPEIPAELLNRCQIAKMLPLWIYNHVFSWAYIEAVYDDNLYLVGDRTDAIKKVLDVFVQSPVNLLGWVDGSWNSTPPASTQAENLIKLLEMRDYITSEEVQAMFYCALDEFGRMDAIGYLGLLSLLEADIDFEDPATNFYNFMRAFGAGSIAVWTAQGSYSEYVDLAADCSEFDCTLWSVTMDFEADDWSNSVDLIVGDYDGVYISDLPGDEQVTIEIPFEIVSGTITVYNEDSLPNESVAVREIGGTVWEYFPKNVGERTFTLANSYLGGIEITIIASLGGTPKDSEIRSVTLVGTGTKPLPD